MYQDSKKAFTLAALVSGEFSHQASNAVTWRVKDLRLTEGRIHLGWQLPEVKDYNGDMQRPPDFGHSILQVAETTRVWKGNKQVTLQDIAVGDVLLANVTSEQKGQPSRATDLWIGEDTHKALTEAQKKKKGPVAKR